MAGGASFRAGSTASPNASRKEDGDMREEPPSRREFTHKEIVTRVRFVLGPGRQLYQLIKQSYS